MKKNKTGKLNKQELKYISAWKAIKTPAEIAEHLKRNVELIEQAIVSLEQATSDQDKWKRKLKARFEWKQIRREFIEEECDYFLNRYADLMTQFSGDILSSEESQLFLLIKLEILLSRNLQDRKRTTIEIDRLQATLDDMYKEVRGLTSVPQETRNLLISIENQLSSARAAQSSKTGEFTKLSERTSSILEDLKASRKQRIERAINSKVSFIELIKTLADSDVQHREGRFAGLVKLSADKEYKKLGEFHQYCDNSVDRIILSADTVKEDK